MKKQQKYAAMVSALVVLIVAVASGPVHAALFSNGSFETPAVGSGVGGAQGTTHTTQWESGTDVNGWTITGDIMNLFSIGTPGNSFGNGPAIPADGSQYLSIEGNSHLGAGTTISQTFDTTPGNLYTITFDWAVLLGGGAGTYDLTYKIGAASAVTLPLTVAAGGGASLTAWNPITSFSYTALGSSTTLTFSGADTAGAADFYGTVLDNVALNDITPPPPVPEPTTFALLLIGGGLLVFRRRYAA